MKATNTYHYFLVCPVLATPRVTLLTRVSQVLSNIPNQYVFLPTRQSSSELHDSNLFPLDINLQLFNMVEEYIVNSQRFIIAWCFRLFHLSYCGVPITDLPQRSTCLSDVNINMLHACCKPL